MEDLDTKFERNSNLLNSISTDEWIKLLKELAISSFFISKDEEIKAINEANRISIKFGDTGLEDIVIVTSKLPWEDFKIGANISSIVISRQKGHSIFEIVQEFPLSAVRVLLESKLRTYNTNKEIHYEVPDPESIIYG